MQYLEQMFADSLEFSQDITVDDYESISQAIFDKFEALPTTLGA